MIVVQKNINSIVSKIASNTLTMDTDIQTNERTGNERTDADPSLTLVPMPADNFKLTSISVCELNTKFSSNCSTDWSQTNYISIVSPDGIYILKPQLDIAIGPFQIELIKNPTQKFSHHETCNIGPTIETIAPKLDNNQYLEIFMNPAIMTQVSNRSFEYYSRKFRLARWSPIIDVYPRQCLLAVITMDYQLLIYAKTNNTWNVHVDLSKVYDGVWNELIDAPESQGFPDKKKNDEFSRVCRNLHELSFINICWKECIENGPMLLAATMTGDIVIWQVILTKGDEDDGKKCEQHLDIKIIVRTEIANIVSMDISDNLLLISSRGGQAVIYDLSSVLETFEKFDEQSHNSLETMLSIVALPPLIVLWVQDGIDISGIYMQKTSPESYRIVLCKSTNICWCTVNYIVGTNGASSTLVVDDSFSAIDGKDPEVSLHQTPPTALKAAGKNRAYLIADDGSFFQLEFSDTNARNESSSQLTAIRTESIDLSRMIPYGLCTSPKGNLVAMVSCIGLMYETGKILAPSKVLLLPWTNDKTFVVDCIDKVLDEKWLTKENIKSPMDVSDRLDHLRSIYPLLSFEHYYELYKKLEILVKRAQRPRNEYQHVRQKIIAFLLMKLLDHKYSKMIESNLLVNLHNTIYPMIELYNRKLVLKSALNLCGPARKRNKATTSSDKSMIQYLSRLQQISLLHTFKRCYDIENTKGWIRDNIDEAENEINSKLKVLDDELKSQAEELYHELCPVCRDVVLFETPKFGICKNMHQFNRCERSLLLVDIYEKNDLVCEDCKRHYLTQAIWPISNKWLCMYCQ